MAVLKKSKGRIRGAGGAAEILNLPPTTLKSKMKKIGIQKDDSESSESYS
jgi:transcriptional regulator with GAF, ATPase, and Fis domain